MFCVVVAMTNPPGQIRNSQACTRSLGAVQSRAKLSSAWGSEKGTGRATTPLKSVLAPKLLDRLEFGLYLGPFCVVCARSSCYVSKTSAQRGYVRPHVRKGECYASSRCVCGGSLRGRVPGRERQRRAEFHRRGRERHNRGVDAGRDRRGGEPRVD